MTEQSQDTEWGTSSAMEGKSELSWPSILGSWQKHCAQNTLVPSSCLEKVAFS